ncbi:mitochondrial mRNA pseudouridine synthase RPUSD3 [Parasteatoda tepidariorum]|uniref:mitochondrial mRNA pseudouridine synthase RPUSD3 n=1 Tax=Parasteatoda tepidariorum TaxID=114398 RepID=UPI001C7246F0|nr:mitochondrial mRNA pseudouridine synthase RPUSD3 [Parasteatoda tepidariorum]
MTCFMTNKLFSRRNTLLKSVLIKYVHGFATQTFKKRHCFKILFPWKSEEEFGNSLISSIVYKKDGLIALNKPFGVKIHSHDKPGARSKPGQRKIVPTIAETDYTIEDALPILKSYLKAPGLSILKSAEKYTSGIVLLGENEQVSLCLKKSIEKAKQQKTPHLIHWMLTHGVPVIKDRKERVAIKLLSEDADQPKQPIIVFQFSRRNVKSHILHPVNVEYKVLAENKTVSSSLIEVASSSVVYHFVRVYASTRIVPILGDILYGSRMNTVLGMPVRLHIQHAQAQDMQPLPKKMSEALDLPKGLHGHTMMPTMLHFRSILLPTFAGKEDVIITAPPPIHFQWTAEQLNLLNNCK